MKDEKIVDSTAEISDAATTFNENAVTGKDFKDKVKEISEILENVSIAKLKLMFEGAMKARGAEQDMSKFDPFTVGYVDLFIRQINGAVAAFDWDDLCQFHKYVIELKCESDKDIRHAKIEEAQKEYNIPIK